VPLEGLGILKKFNDLFGSQNRDLPTCSIVPQPTKLPRTSTKKSCWGKGRQAHKSDNLTAVCDATVCKMWEPRRLTTLWASTVCYKDSSYFTATFVVHPHLVIMGIIHSLSWPMEIMQSQLAIMKKGNNLRCCKFSLYCTNLHRS
jgi:hypothetical protein